MSIPLMLLALLILASLAVVGYRKFVTRDEDDLVHLGEGSVQHTARQEAMTKTIAQIDRFMKILVTVTVVYGLGVGAMMVYQALNNTTGSM
jgi:type II secretory pathway component PulJ